MTKEIKLLQLKLKNFKGIKEFCLDTRGANVKVYGDNGAGKTTLFDSFTWLLFDKDSKDNSTQKFDIKTLNESGEVIHGLDHEVEAILEINGSKLTLKKTYYEKWTKKRGSAEKKFTGHTTDYALNGVPVKKSEYDQRISEIIDEDIFKLLTNPSYFNEQLHWQDRREILLEVCGDVDDQEVIDSNSQLEKLQDILEERSLEDHKKVVAAKKKEINRQLDKLPVRIDEVTQGLPDISDLDKKEITLKIADLEQEKKQKEQQINRIESGGEVAEKQKRLAEIETELLNIKNNHRAEFEDKIEAKKDELEKARDEFRALEREISSKAEDEADNDSKIEELEEKAEKLREKWYEVDDREFDFDQKEVCPTCGQDIPQEQLQEARDKARADFNQEKSDTLESINAEGKQIKQKSEKLMSENKRLREGIESLEDQKTDCNEKAEQIKKEIESLKEKAKAYQESDTYQEKLEEKEQIKQDIEGLKRDRFQKIRAIEKEVDGIEEQIDELQSKLNDIEQYEKAQERIEELKAKEKELAAEYSKMEEQMYLCEEFTRCKVNMLEEKINDEFDHAHFKLFEEQINGGLKEVCQTLYQGVPYGTGLNNGACINVGLDIINTLSKHHQFQAPIFIDNRESVTELIDVNSQLISLIVSKQDKELRVEREELKEAI
jgi:DNA repair exonuclease SbcCD ATPase subunit